MTWSGLTGLATHHEVGENISNAKPRIGSRQNWVGHPWTWLDKGRILTAKRLP
jgi:hypothetical protein